MKIGLCSPFNPQQSGISDYCEELIPFLGEKCEIVIFSPVELSNKKLAASFPVYPVSELDNAKIRDSLDLIVYHIGNNYLYHHEIADMFFKYGGILELHDIRLFHFVAGESNAKHTPEWLEDEAEYCHGSFGRDVIHRYFEGSIPMPWETVGLEMTMNKRFIDRAKGVIVHSDFARQAVLAASPEVPVAMIRLYSQVRDTDTSGLRRKLGIDPEKTVFGSFGMVTPSKRVASILEAVSLLSDDIKKRILFLIVGDMPEDSECRTLIQEKGLEEIVQITGYVSLEEFEDYLGACDFCFNLRYPSQGESSGSLHRMLGMGKPAVLTDIAAYSEYPDGACAKISHGDSEVQEIFQVITKLSSDREELAHMSAAAKKYVENNCDIRDNAEKYARFFEKMIDSSWRPEFEDRLITDMMELGLTSERYIGHVSRIADSMIDD